MKPRLDESQGGIKIAGRNINNLRYADDTILRAKSEENLMKVKEESEKVGLKLKSQKTKIIASGPITSWQINGKTVKKKKKKVKVKSLSSVRLFAAPWTIAYQAPPSMGFSRQEYWSGLPFPSPGDLPDPGIELGSLAFQADALSAEPPGKPQHTGRIR